MVPEYVLLMIACWRRVGMCGGTIWEGKPEGGPVSRTGRGEDAVAQYGSKRGLFSRKNGQRGLVSWSRIGGFPGFLFTDENDYPLDIGE
jgi:hypothetical protein